ncbi:3,4-dihydroxy-2-butanone-4-phosphate synthase [Alphaproteobacteria bacterium]|nr:3,4-dihydroxy-2-butanone-4-phosphate synthase [Alphaproteobacteria bacterium]
MELSNIEEIVECARNGKLFVLVDDENRENEGDLIFPAQLITPNIINFMAKYGRGLICLALTEARSKLLDLKPMDRRNSSKFDTAFTVSIEAKEGVTTGISAADRARTIQTAIDSTKDKDDLTTPGHIFPLVAKNGGVLSRAGHTEAAIDIARLAGLNPSAVICEIMNDDGSMARVKDLKKFCKHHELKLASIEDLIRWRVHKDPIVKRIFSDKLITDFAGDFDFYCYSNQVDKTEHFALVKGNISEEEDTLVRVQKINFVNDLFKGQLLQKQNNTNTIERAMIEINKTKKGVLVIIKDNKSEFILGPSDTIARSELREYGVGAQILRDLRVRKMLLLTNSKQEIIGLDGFDLKIVGKISL